MSSRRRPITRRVREFRRTEALARQAEYDKLTVHQKLEKLPAPPASARQRAKLLALLPGAKEHDSLVGLMNSNANSEKVKREPPKVSFGAMLPPAWVGKTASEINELRQVDSEGRFIKFGEETSNPSKALRAKDRRAQEKN